jgi:hypothetical protein
MSHNKNALMRLVTPYMDPKTLARFAATSRNARAMSSPKQKEYALIKRLVRRRAAIVKHARSPTTGRRTRIASPLYANRMEAVRRAEAIRRAKTPENAKAIARAMKLRRLRQTAARAYVNYQQAGTNAAWNRFVRIHYKSGGGNITENNARRMYN